jgi:hypothetical protein
MYAVQAPSPSFAAFLLLRPLLLFPISPTTTLCFPHDVHVKHRFVFPNLVLTHGVALQVAFERQILKPAFHLIGYRLWV